MRRYDTAISVIMGVIASVIFSFVPFSTVIGAAVAGFLQGPDNRDGMIVGSLVGVVTFVPFVLFALFALFFLGFASAGFGAVDPGGAFAFALFVIGVGFMLLVYTVVPAAVGGMVGAWLAREYPDTHARACEVLRTEPQIGTTTTTTTTRYAPDKSASPEWDKPPHSDRATDESTVTDSEDTNR